MFGGVVPYVPQYLQIRQKQTTQGFSLYVCLALLLANTLRIIFWFGKHYETPLLIQSILMNICMFALVQLCVSVNNKDVIVTERRREHVFTDLDPNFLGLDRLHLLRRVHHDARCYRVYADVLPDRLRSVRGDGGLPGGLHGGHARCPAVLQESQEQVNVRDVDPDGVDVVDGGRLQDLLFLPQEHPAPVLHLRLTSGLCGPAYPGPGMVVSGEHQQEEEVRAQHEPLTGGV